VRESERHANTHTHTQVEEYLHLAGKKEILAQVLYRWLFRHRNKGGVALAPSEEWTFDKLPSDLPRDLRAALVQDFALTTSKVVQCTNSDSGGFKLMIQLQDGHLVETVVIRHEHLSSANVRYTICVSSQVGCAMCVWDVPCERERVCV
jgi:23S rRNA (adenine2503-C2)-methyltransferase